MPAGNPSYGGETEEVQIPRPPTGLPQSLEMNNVSVPMANMSMSSSQPSALPPMKPQAPTINNNTGTSRPVSQMSGVGQLQPLGANRAGSQSVDNKNAPASFVNKPARGWLHPDNLIAKDGINYAVRYIGYLEVNTSMKILDFDTRSAIAKESIARVCEENQNHSQQQIEERLRQVDRKIAKMLGDRVFLSGTGSNVQLTITSLCLKLSDLDSGTTILQHEMPMISFASGGDSDTINFIAYVAKDKHGGRGCYVLYCGGGLAQDVITTIGQAFELRFKEFLKKTPGPRPPPLTSLRSGGGHQLQGSGLIPLPDDVEYYNDLPGKAPPPTTPSNLIDFNTEIQNIKSQYVNTEGMELPHNHQQQQPHNNFHQQQHHPAATTTTGNPTRSGRPRDPFDMSPFALNPPGGGIPSPSSLASGGFGLPSPTGTGSGVGNLPSPLGPNSNSSNNSTMKTQLNKEPWFHGPISRTDAECLLVHDGDFLVRESSGSSGQYVLTGMQANNRKHLLLVDPEGVVRTRDRTFQSVSHLIEYHRKNNLPIISAESALRLQRPVNKR